MNAAQLRHALTSAEDAIAFFTRAALMRHLASLARDAGSISEAARYTRMATDAELIVAKVIAGVLARLKAPPTT